jgi:hypothetical protein
LDGIKSVLRQEQEFSLIFLTGHVLSHPQWKYS